MKKYGLLIVGVLLMTGALSLREWLLVEEISVTQNQVREQMAQSIQTAPTIERVERLGLSSVVYERFLEPVFEITSRLLWTPLRTDYMSSWKREIHAKTDDLSASRIAELTGDSEKQIAKIKADSKPSINRLYDILKMSDGNSTSSTCSATVQEEMKLVREAGQKKDQEILANLKVEGIAQLKHFEKLIKGMSKAQMGEFLKSGRFVREIQEPILEYVFQIKQEEVRRAAWNEFDNKLNASLSKKGFPVAKVKDHALSAQKRIERLFNTMTEAKGREFPAIAPQGGSQEDSKESKLVIPEPHTPSFPSDAGGDFEDSTAELQSPSDANAVE